MIYVIYTTYQKFIYKTCNFFSKWRFMSPAFFFSLRKKRHKRCKGVTLGLLNKCHKQELNKDQGFPWTQHRSMLKKCLSVVFLLTSNFCKILLLDINIFNRLKSKIRTHQTSIFRSAEVLFERV